jgi:hypothetical protein
MVNQVGKPAIFEGKRFFPLMGTPIRNIALINTLFED